MEERRKKQNEWARNWRRNNRDKINKLTKQYHMRRTYGISLEELGLMKEAQEWKCALCGNTGRLCVDHDHKTGKVRELLCVACNFAVGSVERKGVDFVAKIVDYVRRYAI